MAISEPCPEKIAQIVPSPCKDSGLRLDPEGAANAKPCRVRGGVRRIRQALRSQLLRLRPLPDRRSRRDAPPEELELFRRARNGCQQSAEVLVERYSEALLRVIRHHLNLKVRSVYDSVDVLQSAWAVVFCRPVPPEAFESLETLVAYLRGVARNKTLQTNRKYLEAEKRTLIRQGPPDSDVPDPQPSAERVVTAKDQWERLLLRLDPEWREGFRLLRDGHSQADVARRLGITEWTLRRLLQRVREYWGDAAGV